MDRDYAAALLLVNKVLAAIGREPVTALATWRGCVDPIENTIGYRICRCTSTTLYVKSFPGLRAYDLTDPVRRFVRKVDHDFYPSLIPQEKTCDPDRLHRPRCPDSARSRIDAAQASS